MEVYFESVQELLEYSKKYERKCLKEFISDELLQKRTGKGRLGQLIETEVYGMKNNSKKEADFKHLGVELKVTPVKENKNGLLTAKERLVLSIINYETDYSSTFDESHLMEKINEILLWVYKDGEDISLPDCEILKVMMFKIPEEDRTTIIEDYNIIIEKILEGKAHEISESDTTYLAACTKGSTAAASYRTQPFSLELAKQRAWSFKNSYMTNYYNSTFLINGKIKDEGEVALHVRSNQTLDEKIHEILKPYIGMSFQELGEHFNDVTKAKSAGIYYIGKIFGTNYMRLNEISEFRKANVQCRTIRYEETGRIREDMSFKNFNFKDIAMEKTFEDSQFYNFFNETKFLFFEYQYSSSKDDYVLKGFRWWNLPYEDYALLKETWYNLRKAIHEGVIIQHNGKTFKYPNLPKKSQNPFHVRTKSRGGEKDVKDMLPDGREIAKHCLFVANSKLK